MESLFIVTSTVVLLTALCECVFLIFTWQQRKKSVSHTAFFVFVLMMTIWTLSIFANLFLADLFIESIIFSSGITALTAQVFFVSSFAQRKIRYTPTLIILTLISTFLALVSFIPGSVFTAITVTPHGYTLIESGTLSGAYSLYVLILTMISIGILIKKYRKSKKGTLLRKQLYYLTLGLSIFFIIITLTNSILPVFFKIHFFNAIGSAFSLILIAFYTYIITRYRFLDLRFALQRGALYTLIIVAITILYTTIIFLFSIVIEHNTRLTTILSVGITTTISVLTMPILEKWFRKKTNPLFFKDYYDPNTAFLEIGKILEQDTTTKTLIKKISAHIEQLMHIKSASIIVPSRSMLYHKGAFHTIDKEIDATTRDVLGRCTTILFDTDSAKMPHPAIKKFFICYNIGALIPLRAKNTITNFLILGKKRSGDLYTDRDEHFLHIIAHHISGALEKARLYEKEQSYLHNLEQQVHKRTARIHAMQKEQKQLLLDIAHSIQTPLTIVRGHVETIYKDLPEQKVHAVQGSIDRVSVFIARLLRLARLSAQVGTATKEKVDLSLLLEEFCEYFFVVLDNRKIILKNNIAPDLLIHANADHIKEVITTIAENAAKYMGDSNKRIITITAVKDPTHKPGARITIADTGIGINTEDLPHVFEQFYRGKTKTATHGSGLGLAVAKKIIGHHHGSIAIDSISNNGTTVTITIPLCTSNKIDK